MSSPFFPAICWHVDGASLAPRYLFDLPIFIPAFDYPITLEIICEPTRGFSLNNNPATRPSLFSHSFILHRQNRRENKKGFKKPHEERCHRDRRTFPLQLLSLGMLAALRCLSNRSCYSTAGINGSINLSQAASFHGQSMI